MKFHLTTLLAILMFGGQVFAQSWLKVSLSDRSKITVAVDSRYFNQRGESVTVGNLPPGRHNVRIFTYRQDEDGTGYQKTVFEGMVKTYRDQVTILTYDTYYRTTATSYAEGGYANNSQPGEQRHDYPENTNEQQTGNNQNYNSQNNSNNQVDNSNSYQPPAATSDRATNEPAASPVKKDEILNETPAKNAKLDKVKKKVLLKNTDTERMKLVNASFKKDRLSTDQVCKIMDWFSFESSKMEFAQWAYTHVTDKHNYSKTRDKLTYKSYREEMDQFLKTNQ